MKYYLVAGEASGDLHAANLVKALRRLDPQAEFRGIGGDKMRAVGVDLLLHLDSISFMGLWEVVVHLGTLQRALLECRKDIERFQPDVFIPVDYPGFNLRMLRHAKRLGIKTCYYISPKLWAWRASRVEVIKRFADRVLLIFPFEDGFYKHHGYHNAIFVGNPLLDELSSFRISDDFRRRNDLTERPVVALLPGSRQQEIARCLPRMVACASAFAEVQFVVAGMKHTKPFINAYNLPGNVNVVYDQTYDLLGHSAAAIVTSGTATLETALLKVPQICAYRTSPLTYAVARRLIKVRFISLVNLVANRAVIPELIQDAMTPENLVAHLRDLLPGGEKRDAMLAGYADVRAALHDQGASQRAAEVVRDLVAAVIR